MLRLQRPLPDDYTLAAPAELEARIAAAKAELAERLLILGHHYQRDEVIRWADSRGDSLKLARYAAENDWASDIVFCGVHFMAESADILTGPDQRVVLPDLNAGCSMADMADADEVEECWEALAEVIDVDRVVPITYVNSSAAVKAFVGRHGGACCTSSNARGVLTWALERGDRVLFVPDQHLGRNTALAMGFPASEMKVWDPRHDLGGLEERDVKRIRQHLVDQICTAAGGPCFYPGRDMKTVHAEMEITEEVWNAFTGHIGETLRAFKVGERERNELVVIVGSLKADIVKKPAP